MHDGPNRGGLATSSDENAGLAGAASTHQARLQRFLAELQSNRISLSNLRSLAFYGIPDKKGLRALTWKVGCAQASGFLPAGLSS